MDIGFHCRDPYVCDYLSYCGRHLPSPSIFDVAGLFWDKKFKYYHQGIISFQDIIDSQLPLTDTQKRQVETELYIKADEINKEKIRAFLNTLNYPLYHLDFETFSTPVPLYDGLRPYEQIPFQYSLHIEQADGTLEHREFLAEEGKDPRRAVAERLCADIPSDVCVLAYNMSFEKRVLKQLAELFPDLSEHLLAVRANARDLMIPFKQQSYYTRAMAGSYSIKQVLPALCPGDPELDYHALEGVHNGEEASSTYASLASRPPEEVAEIRKNLLAYCRLDTLAMVKILEKLKESVNE